MCPNMYKLNHILSRHFQKSYNSSRCYTKQLKCFSITTAWQALVNNLLWGSIIHTVFLPRLLRSNLRGLLMFLSFSSLSPFMMYCSQNTAFTAHSTVTAFNSLLPLLSDLLLWKKGVAIHGTILVRKSQLMLCGTPPRFYRFKREEVILGLLKFHLPPEHPQCERQPSLCSVPDTHLLNECLWKELSDIYLHIQ